MVFLRNFVYGFFYETFHFRCASNSHEHECCLIVSSATIVRSCPGTIHSPVCDLPLLQNDHVLEGTIQFRGNFVHNFILEGIAYLASLGSCSSSASLSSRSSTDIRASCSSLFSCSRKDLKHVTCSSLSCGNMENAKSSKVAGASIFMLIQRA